MYFTITSEGGGKIHQFDQGSSEDDFEKQRQRWIKKIGKNLEPAQRPDNALTKQEPKPFVVKSIGEICGGSPDRIVVASAISRRGKRTIEAVIQLVDDDPRSHNCWRAEGVVSGNAMTTGHCDTRADAEKKAKSYFDGYLKVHGGAV